MELNEPYDTFFPSAIVDVVTDLLGGCDWRFKLGFKQTYERSPDLNSQVLNIADINFTSKMMTLLNGLGLFGTRRITSSHLRSTNW